MSHKFDHTSRIYQPHESLGVRYRIEGIDDEKVRAVERSAVWYTEGKGEEDEREEEGDTMGEGRDRC